MIYIVTLPIAVYLVLILYAGLKFRINSDQYLTEDTLGVTVLIPCRNEEPNIRHCLKSICLQKYNSQLFEVIVIDDNSNDQTISISKTFEDKLRLKVLKSNGEGKKEALKTGIQAARFQVILTLDADCHVGALWIKSMADKFSINNLNMLCGPVSIDNHGSVFSSLQQTESAAIVSISAVLLNAGFPATCNGANLMFRKDVFEQLNGYTDHLHLSSGDDDILMQKFYALDAKRTRYMLDPHSLVYAAPNRHWRELFNQRLRWISKRKSYQYPYNSIVQALVVLHLISFYTLCVWIVISGSLFGLLLIALKFGADLFYAGKISSLFEFKRRMIFLMPFYQLYILYILWLNGFVKAKWKGRVIHS